MKNLVSLFIFSSWSADDLSANDLCEVEPLSLSITQLKREGSSRAHARR